MKTAFFLMAEFNTSQIPLEEVGKRYFGLSKERTLLRAARQDFPFHVYRLGGQKSPWVVDVNDLAEWIEACRAEGRAEWDKRQTG